MSHDTISGAIVQTLVKIKINLHASRLRAGFSCSRLTVGVHFAAAFADVAEPERRSSVCGGPEPELLHVEWVQETPEDLDVCIAQRDFEGAVDLVEKGRPESYSYKGGGETGRFITGWI